jgi:hypothetical protein
MGADHDCRLQMHIDQRDAACFARQSRAEDGAWCEHEIKAVSGVLVDLNGLEKTFGALARKLKDEFRAVIKLPDSRIGDESLKVFGSAQWNDFQSSITHGVLKQAGDDHRHPVAARFQQSAEPEKWEDISSTAKWKKSDV